MFDSLNQDEPMSQIRNGIDRLAGEDRSRWVSVALSERLAEAAELRNRLDAEVLRLTGEWIGGAPGRQTALCLRCRG